MRVSSPTESSKSWIMDHMIPHRETLAESPIFWFTFQKMPTHSCQGPRKRSTELEVASTEQAPRLPENHTRQPSNQSRENVVRRFDLHDDGAVV